MRSFIILRLTWQVFTKQIVLHLPILYELKVSEDKPLIIDLAMGIEYISN
ncbi:hypothetical protein ACFSQ0_07595 [Mesonia sediminis]|uniref:Uncharacterized protein n=1 Tax=Mesonia sediminis TaxID=1703946 RepID=A0ABW5SGK4_9FLAO